MDSSYQDRGSCVAEVIGQGIEPTISIPLVFIYPLAAQDAALVGWAVQNLSAPSAVHLAQTPSSALDVSGASNFVQKVEKWRMRSRRGPTED